MADTQNPNDAQNLNANVTNLRHLGRQEHFDSEGGGRIIRSIYCEPYTAHKRVATALRGTVYNAGGSWARAYPHRDPLYPWFYCQDVQVEPAFPAAARASRPMPFNENANDGIDQTQNRQFREIQRSLHTLDDYDGAGLIDNLAKEEIAAGGPIVGNQGDTQSLNTSQVIPVNSYDSRGVCGARITATYVPLLFQPGLTSNLDPFDYVDPQPEPVTFTTQTGRSLFLAAPYLGGLGLFNGLSDTFALPEVVWRFSIRRLMVPFLPAYTIAAYANKVNASTFQLGDLKFPPGTVRAETPEVITRRAPDGQLYYDLLLKFLVRRLYDEYFDPVDLAYKKGWIGWNWAYAIPHGRGVLAGIQMNRACYYPPIWNGGLFQLFGANHPLFLQDSDVDAGIVPGGISGISMDIALFNCGFKKNQ